MPESRTIRTKYGRALESTNLADSFATNVDSACFGRKLALSFSWTSLSLPTVGPPRAPSTSQPISTAAMAARHFHRPWLLSCRTLSPPPVGHRHSTQAGSFFSHHPAPGVREPFRRRNNKMTTWKHPGHSVLA